MPLPKPKDDETKQEFLDRCMGDDVMVTEYPDEKQRYAVCQSQWEKDRSTTPGPVNMERRILPPEEIELRVEEGDKPKLVGYAAKFGKWSLDFGGWREKIHPKAFDAVLEDDVRALKNHDPNLLLGRTTSGTLRLSTNTVGLRFEVDLPNTTTGRDTLEEVRRKDITGCSFAFTVVEDTWKNHDDGTAERTITQVGQLFDVGPVTYPAYPDTTVAARSLGRIRAGQQRADAYMCECIECGHTLESEDHCKDILCPECGGQMRRQERPGPGRAQKTDSTKTKLISAEPTPLERHRMAALGRKAERIINRNRPKADA